MAFLETPRFPDDIAIGAVGGPVLATNVVQVNSGYEQRNAPHAHGLGQWEVGHVARAPDKMATLIAFFRAVGGKRDGFRFKDHTDYKASATEGVLGSGLGTGSATVFQLRKVYTAGALSHARDIRKPVGATVKIYKNAVLQTVGVSLDATTGLATFSAAPLITDVLTWEGEFDVPARFDTDQMRMNLLHHAATDWQSIAIVEIRV